MWGKKNDTNEVDVFSLSLSLSPLLSLSLSLSLSHTHIHTYTHPHTHAHTGAHTHTQPSPAQSLLAPYTILFLIHHLKSCFKLLLIIKCPFFTHHSVSSVRAGTLACLAHCCVPCTQKRAKCTVGVQEIFLKE